MRNHVYNKYTKFRVATTKHCVTNTEKVLKYTLKNIETG